MSESWGESSSEPPPTRTVSASFDTSSKLISTKTNMSETPATPATYRGNFNWNSQSELPSSSMSSPYQKSQTPKLPKRTIKSMFGALEEKVEVRRIFTPTSNYLDHSCSHSLHNFEFFRS